MFDTFTVYVGVYPDVDSAGTDYGLVEDLHRRAGGELLPATTAGAALLGAVAGQTSTGMSRHDLGEFGEHLDSGQGGLVVVGVSDTAAKIEREMRHAEKVEKKQLHVSVEDIEREVTSARVASRPPVFG